jgi:hypothetical protein
MKATETGVAGVSRKKEVALIWRLAKLGEVASGEKRRVLSLERLGVHTVNQI